MEEDKRKPRMKTNSKEVLELLERIKHSSRKENLINWKNGWKKTMSHCLHGIKYIMK